jgi:hypothetical protein
MSVPPWGRSNATVYDDVKATQADAACTAAFKLLNDPQLSGKLSPEARAKLKAAADKAWFDLAVYRGELSKQQRRSVGGPPVALASTQAMTQGGGTPFGVLIGITILAGAALGAIAAGLSQMAERARFSLDASLTGLRDQSNEAIQTVPRPLTQSPGIPKPIFDELVRLGILLSESTVISIDFSTLRKKIVEIMKGIEDLMKQNKNPCNDLYVIVRNLALLIFSLLDTLPANDNDGGKAVIRITNEFVKWMKAVNDLFDCFELPAPFPRVT